MTKLNITYSVVDTENTNKLTLAFNGKESIFELHKLICRAINTWPDCPNEWKELADIIAFGKPLQNYDVIYK